MRLAFEDHALLDHERRRGDVTVDLRRPAELDGLRGLDVAGDLALDDRRAARPAPRSAPSPTLPKITGRPPGRNSAAGMARKSPARKPNAAPKKKPTATTVPIRVPTAGGLSVCACPAGKRSPLGER